MNEKPNPISEQDLERALSAMTEPDTTAPERRPELWREALQEVGRERRRKTRAIPGRRRLAKASLSAAVLMLGIGLTLVMTREFGVTQPKPPLTLPSVPGTPASISTQPDSSASPELVQAPSPLPRSLLSAPDLEDDVEVYDVSRQGRSGPPTPRGRGQHEEFELAASAVPVLETDLAGMPMLAPEPAPASTEAAPTVALPMLERSADLRIRTLDVDDAVSQSASLLDTSAGEYVVRSQTDGDEHNRSASIALRVASHRFETVLQEIRQLGRVASFESSSIDLSADAKALRDEIDVAESTERDLLERFESLPDPLASETYEARRQIRGVRSEVDDFEAQLRLIESRSNWSTIRVTFAVSSADASADHSDTFTKRFADAISEGVDSLGHIAIWLTRVLITSVPITAALGVVAWLLWRRFTRP